MASAAGAARAEVGEPEAAPAAAGAGAGPRAASPAAAVALAVTGGLAVSFQAWVNGRLAGRLDSTELAATVNNVVALLTTGSAVLLTRAAPRGIARLRALPRRPPLWQFLGGLIGASLVLVTTAAAPVVGVALVTVAVVCGSTAGGLPVDAAGLGPAGRRPVTAWRVTGVALAVAATVLGAVGARGDLQPLLLSLALLAGAGVALQTAANGRLAEASGEPLLASLVNTVVGLLALLVVVVATAPLARLGALPADPVLYAGGLCGAFVVLVGATMVRILGVLRLGLALVAGQTAGALMIDLLAPAPGEAVTAGTVLGVALTLLAVWVSGRSPGAGRPGGADRSRQ